MQLAPHHRAALDELLWAVDAQAGQFALVFVRCNSQRLWRALLREMRDRHPLDLCEISTEASNTTTLFDRCLHQLERRSQPPDAVVLHHRHDDSDRLLARLNQIREEFRKTLHLPVLWHVSDRLLQRLVRVAPDLESWSTTVSVELSPDEAIAFVNDIAEDRFDRLLEAGAGRFLDNTELDRDRDSALRQDIDLLLPDLLAPTSPDDTSPAASDERANLEFVAAIAATDDAVQQECYERSLHHLERAIATATNGDPEPRLVEKYGAVLYCLGALWRSRAERFQRDYERDCDRACDDFSRCVEWFEQHRRFDLVAKFINARGDILERLGRWDDLHHVGNSAVALHRSYPNPFRLARAYGFLAEVALARQEWDRARDAAQQALEISHHAPPDDRITHAADSQVVLDWTRSFNQGAYYYSLGRARLGLGDPDGGIQTLETALTKTSPDYEPRLYTHILQTLSATHFQQGEYLRAFRLKQQRHALEYQYGFRAFLGAGKLQPRKALDSGDTGIHRGDTRFVDRVAPAIAASGRDRDLARLVERIARVDRKLTVLHGQSGVGKSSLLQAGLVPQLETTAVGSRDAVPLLVTTYGDWGDRLAEACRNARSPQFRALAPHTADPATLLASLRAIADRNGISVLIFDQFEEFFTTYRDRRDRQPFYDFLHACLNQPYLKLVLSLREDCLHLLLDLGRHIDLDVLNHNLLDPSILYDLGDFSPESARSVIASLTEDSRVPLEPALVDRLVADLTQPETNRVRPIELQIVGAQLQSEGIVELDRYRDLGDRPQETLVQRYLADTLANCGSENQRAAQLVLYLLTDDSRARPLRTREELTRDLRAHGADLAVAEERLDLILCVCIESGLVYLFRDARDTRYQLVHDDLVDTIRRSETAKLLQKLQRLEAERRETRDSLNRWLQWGLWGASLAALAMTGLFLFADGENRRANRAPVRSLASLSLYASARLHEQHEFGALLESLRLGAVLDDYPLSSRPMERRSPAWARTDG